jgi:hypothetical protein
MNHLNHLNFGVNTDSFLGIGSGFLTDRNVELLKSSFSEYFEFLNNYNIFNIEINTEIEQLSRALFQMLLYLF